jgi:hypothetical protein
MSDSNDKNAKIFRIIFVFISAFFLLIIIFNIWMKVSLEKTGALSVPKTVAGKKEIKKASPIVSEPAAEEQKSERTEKGFGDQPTGERRLILQ